MRLRSCFLILLFLGSRVSAQVAGPLATDHAPPANFEPPPSAVWTDAPPSAAREMLASNRNFPNFIGFLSNPLQNIDPRSLTQVVPIFLDSHVSTGPALPDLSAQVYGPAFSLALSDRFSVGLNQGGFASLVIDRNDTRPPLLSRPTIGRNDPRFPLLAQAVRDRILRDRVVRNRGDEFGGNRDGFLDLGGYAQYTFIEDVEHQFLATGGVRVVVPCGSYELFQGKGPALLAPYLTAGKEFGNFHLLATTGYQFPARSGDSGTELFYLNAHLDRQCFGWVYPLVEVNWTNHTTSVDVALPTRRGIIDLGNFSSTGNVVTMAAGANLVLIPDRLELGAVYNRSVSTQRNIDIDGMTVKLVFRY